MRAGCRGCVCAEALDLVEIDVGVLSARRGQAGDPAVGAGRSAESSEVEIPSQSDVPPPRISVASAELIKPEWENTGALVVGRHLYEITNAWGSATR